MAYGMTENLGSPRCAATNGCEHPGSVGRGFRDTEIRILNAENRPPGPGELARSTCAHR